jgi:hypothetical protein
MPQVGGRLQCCRLSITKEAKMAESQSAAVAGDLVEVSGRRVGDTPRLGEILEVLGDHDHTRYTVRWEDGHESILYPRDGVTIRPRATA